MLPSVARRSKKSWAEVRAMANTIKVKLVKGLIGTKQSHRATVRGLGLRRLNSERELEDTPAVRGMINKVAYLVKVVS
ncbi:MAG: 50S ribosomal protein L30 [Burkholderiaceae bacterium]|nr:50S ribosomal protein L30 [Burkholderiaceae bacterium]NCV85849.1 50S ribosomal protein L30 [Oxalobacteraceae bacterium]NCW84837.1 50S ribosomal protein L30 [Oxalobacteraceae bacterium]